MACILAPSVLNVAPVFVADIHDFAFLPTQRQLLTNDARREGCRRNKNMISEYHSKATSSSLGYLNDKRQLIQSNEKSDERSSGYRGRGPRITEDTTLEEAIESSMFTGYGKTMAESAVTAAY